MRKLLILLFIPILFISFSIGSSGVTAQADTLPLITYLGEGPGTFTIQAPLLFIVKTYQDNQFLFITAEPPAYEAVARERVWSTNFLPAESIRLFGEWHSYGQVAAGCLVEYVQIDDNVDDRRNIFYLNGTPLHTVAQGMVTYGRFSIPEDGELTFYAADFDWNDPSSLLHPANRHLYSHSFRHADPHPGRTVHQHAHTHPDDYSSPTRHRHADPNPYRQPIPPTRPLYLHRHPDSSHRHHREVWLHAHPHPPICAGRAAHPHSDHAGIRRHPNPDSHPRADPRHRRRAWPARDRRTVHPAPRRAGADRRGMVVPPALETQ